MKKTVLLGLIVGLTLLGCSKRDQSLASDEPPYYPLKMASLSYMPYSGATTLVFVNETGEEIRLNAPKGVETDTVWNYNYDGTSKIYYNEFRRIRFTGYHPDGHDIQLLFDISVVQSKKDPSAVFDLLSITFWDDYTHAPTGYLMDYKLISSTRENQVTLEDIWLSQEPEFISNLNLLGYEFSEVYKEESPDNLEMYCAKGQGIVAFKDLRGYWVLHKKE
ncbi:MAG: hypothetical protein AB3N14_08795 [Flavobacteriaceae bacterium]